MGFDWLYGPSAIAKPQMIQIRSLTLDLDAVRDLLGMSGNTAPAAVPYAVHGPKNGPGTDVAIAPSDLEGLDDWVLRQLTVKAVGQPGIFIDLRAKTQPIFIFNDPSHEALAKASAETLLAAGRPRIRWRAALSRLTLLTLPALVALWVWYVWSEGPPLSLAFVGTALIAIALIPLYQVYGFVKTRVASPWPGHRLLSVTRADVRARRAATKANLKLSLITIPFGAVVGAIVTLIFKG